MSTTMTDHEHVWQEMNRFIPSEADRDPARLFPEHPRDADGKVHPLSIDEYVEPEAHVSYQCTKCVATKTEPIPAEDVKRLQELLDTKQIAPELVSQLPLGEIFESMSEHQGLHSGAKRVSLKQAPNTLPPANIFEPEDNTGGGTAGTDLSWGERAAEAGKTVGKPLSEQDTEGAK